MLVFWLSELHTALLSCAGVWLTKLHTALLSCAGLHGHAGVRWGGEEQGVTGDRTGGPDWLGLRMHPVRTDPGSARLLPACLWAGSIATQDTGCLMLMAL